MGCEFNMKLMTRIKKAFKRKSDDVKHTDTKFNEELCKEQSEVTTTVLERFNHSEILELEWLGNNIKQWAMPNYNFVTRKRKEQVNSNDVVYRAVYSKRPKSSGTYFTYNDICEIKDIMETNGNDNG